MPEGTLGYVDYKHSINRNLKMYDYVGFSQIWSPMNKCIGQYQTLEVIAGLPFDISMPINRSFTAAYFIPQTGLDWTGLDWTGLDWTGLDWTGLDWTGLDWTGLARGLSWKQLLNNNPGIIHLLQHWRHHYRATTAAAGSSLQVMTLAHALIN